MHKERPFRVLMFEPDGAGWWRYLAVLPDGSEAACDIVPTLRDVSYAVVLEARNAWEHGETLIVSCVQAHTGERSQQSKRGQLQAAIRDGVKEARRLNTGPAVRRPAYQPKYFFPPRTRVRRNAGNTDLLSAAKWLASEKPWRHKHEARERHRGAEETL